MPTTEDSDTIPIDWSGVLSDDVRSKIDHALREQGRAPAPSSRFWRSLASSHPPEARRNLLVLADLSECARHFRSVQPHLWASSMRTVRPLIVGLVRSNRDRRFVSDVDLMVRSSGGRFFVCELKRGSSAETSDCIVRALAGLDPHAVTDVRFSVEERSLWLEFGDGLEGSLRWDDLPLGPSAAELRPDTATLAEGGASVQVLRANGEVFDIDASSLRAMLDKSHARRLERQAASSRAQLGKRLRDRRVALGVTQSDLAEKSGLDQALISKLESGRHQPRFDTLEKYAKGLGASVAELLR